MTIPVENTAKKMARRMVNRLLLLATTCMEKFYQLSLFRQISEKESRLHCDWRYIMTHQSMPIELPIFAHRFPIKTFKSATGCVRACTNIFRQSERELSSRTIKIKKSRPISRTHSIYA
jgi:hypothetical protein